MIFRIASFSMDRNLAYVIQNITGDSTTDILSYFHQMAINIVENYAEKKPKHRINKTLEWHYKGTVLPYKLVVYSSYHEKFDQAVVPLYLYVNFPKKKDDVDVTEMINNVVECGLGLEGNEPLPKFGQPNTRVPAGFKRFLHK